VVNKAGGQDRDQKSLVNRWPRLKKRLIVRVSEISTAYEESLS
jgi:hypothetical protein